MDQLFFVGDIVRVRPTVHRYFYCFMIEQPHHILRHPSPDNEWMYTYYSPDNGQTYDQEQLEKVPSLQVGKQYITRNGLHVNIQKEADNGYEGGDSDILCHWDRNGCAFLRILDIVAEVRREHRN